MFGFIIRIWWCWDIAKCFQWYFGGNARDQSDIKITYRNVDPLHSTKILQTSCNVSVMSIVSLSQRQVIRWRGFPIRKRLLPLCLIRLILLLRPSEYDNSGLILVSCFWPVRCAISMTIVPLQRGIWSIIRAKWSFILAEQGSIMIWCSGLLYYALLGRAKMGLCMNKIESYFCMHQENEPAWDPVFLAFIPEGLNLRIF